MQMKLLILLLMGGVTAQAGSPTFTDTFPLGSCQDGSRDVSSDAIRHR